MTWCKKLAGFYLIKNLKTTNFTYISMRPLSKECANIKDAIFNKIKLNNASEREREIDI